jgi:hypothetical protein
VAWQKQPPPASPHAKQRTGLTVGHVAPASVNSWQMRGSASLSTSPAVASAAPPSLAELPPEHDAAAIPTVATRMAMSKGRAFMQYSGVTLPSIGTVAVLWWLIR